MCWSITLISRRQNRSSIGEEAACKTFQGKASGEMRFDTRMQKKRVRACDEYLFKGERVLVRKSKTLKMFKKCICQWQNRYFPDNDTIRILLCIPECFDAEGSCYQECAIRQSGGSN